jgi:hypothetical protein
VFTGGLTSLASDKLRPWWARELGKGFFRGAGKRGDMGGKVEEEMEVVRTRLERRDRRRKGVL